MDADEYTMPFYIYHYHDPEGDTVYGRIRAPDERMNIDERVSEYVGAKKQVNDPFWREYGVFYAVSPDIANIPHNMILICVANFFKYPYSTYDVENVYDPFMRKTDCINMVVYINHMENTIPLKFYRLKGQEDVVVPMLRDELPFNSIKKYEGLWENFATYYVIDPNEKGLGVMRKTKHKNYEKSVIDFYFKCNNGTCVPAKIDDENKHDTLQMCTNRCSSKRYTESILDTIERDVKPPERIKNFFRSLPIMFVATMVSVFIISFVLIIILMIKSS
jgi:hypothetical protein